MIGGDLAAGGGPLHPALILLIGSLLVPLPRGRWRMLLLLTLPFFSLQNLLEFETGFRGVSEFAGMELEVIRIDKLSLLFGYLFHIAVFLGVIYSLHLKDSMQHTTALMYGGSAIGAVFAGDLAVLFIFWELLALTSVFQVWARRTKESRNAGMRYLLLHVFSGLCLLAGTTLVYYTTGSLAFEHFDLMAWDEVVISNGTGLGPWLILLGFGIKACFPPFHTWLVDAYPAATPTGTVFLSSFTTKTAIYALARGFSGADILITVGATMAMFPIFFAVIENDLRRVLGYSMINQIGFMVVGIGLGDGLGVNGAVAHAFNDVIFKGLLFMSMGAVLHRTGEMRGSELGGLYKSMPWTTGFCMVGAASISAFPLFSGFVSKSMVMASAANNGHFYVWMMLLFASAGVFHHAGIKIPFFAFFAHDSGRRPKEAPINMLIAMGIASAACIFIGSFPDYLYSLLPREFEYEPYTLSHVISQTQILFFSALAFVWLRRRGIYPPELKSTNLDSDWFFRRFLPALWNATALPFLNAMSRIEESVLAAIPGAARNAIGIDGRKRPPIPWSASAVVVVVTAMLAIALVRALM
jgi:multicomponent Na+:H+ antiporter subunit D